MHSSQNCLHFSRELELFKNQQHQMPHSIASANGKGAANVLVDTVQGECVVDDDDDTLDKIMVKVSTKQGLHKWEISEASNCICFITH